MFLHSWNAYVAFAAAVAVLIITPGPDIALVLRTTAAAGTRRATLVAIGCCTGSLVWGMLVAVGVGAMLDAASGVYTVLRIAGGGYMCYLGVRLLRPLRPAAVAGLAPMGLPRRASLWVGRGLLATLSNPKVGVFYVTFLPQFVPINVRPAPFMMRLALLNAVEAFLWFAVLLAIAAQASAWLRQPRIVRRLDTMAGLVMLSFGLRIALIRR